VSQPPWDAVARRPVASGANSEVTTLISINTWDYPHRRMDESCLGHCVAADCEEAWIKVRLILGERQMRASIDVAIIGAGPYGLTLAHGLAKRGIEYRIFGKTLELWKANMPPGMLLKSYPWASNLHAGERGFTVKEYCNRHALPYHDTMLALSRETFVAYGDEFQSRLVPNVESRMLQSLTRLPTGFRAEFDDGQIVDARRVVIAVGVQPFRHVPEVLANLPRELCSHSGVYGPLDELAGSDVTIVGAGSSATDLAALLAEEGSSVRLVARAPELVFAGVPRARSWLEGLVRPSSGIGEGWVLTLCAEAPGLVRLLPQSHRVQLAYTPALGPLGGAFMRERVTSNVQVKSGFHVSEAVERGGKVQLHLLRNDGASEIIETTHVVAATGYKMDVRRLGFLDHKIQSDLRMVGSAPVLSAGYESSVPGLHFIGPISAPSFGPVTRFVFGTKHPSRSLPRYLAKALRTTTRGFSQSGVLNTAVSR
jgi:thioredoxin reductase